MRLPLMSAGLKAVNADIVLLQEVYTEVPSGLDVSQYLAHDLGLECVYTPARKKLRTCSGSPVLCHSGLAVLARLPMTAETVRLPDDDRDGERLGQIVQFSWNGLETVIANAHLTHLSDRDDLRAGQLSTLREHLPQKADLSIVGGDLNLIASHPVLVRELEAQGFIASAYKNMPDSTLNAMNGGPPSTGVIDHIYIKSGENVSCTPLAQTALDRVDEQSGLYPSDHKAVVAQVQIA